MNYLVQKPGDVGGKSYSLVDLRVAVASGEVQLDCQARHNGKKMTVMEALKAASTCYECYECGKEISSLAAACPSCGAPTRAAQPSLGSTITTASSTLDFHVAREGKRFGPYTEAAARNYLADGRIRADDLCWRPGMDNWLPVSQVLQPLSPWLSPCRAHHRQWSDTNSKEISGRRKDRSAPRLRKSPPEKWQTADFIVHSWDAGTLLFFLRGNHAKLDCEWQSRTKLSARA